MAMLDFSGVKNIYIILHIPSKYHTDQNASVNICNSCMHTDREREKHTNLAYIPIWLNMAKHLSTDIIELAARRTRKDQCACGDKQYIIMCIYIYYTTHYMYDLTKHMGSYGSTQKNHAWPRWFALRPPQEWTSAAKRSRNGGHQANALPKMVYLGSCT